ncbi:MAG: hypothetical protein RR945_07490 [Erysipelotrichaceae bacterium]
MKNIDINELKELAIVGGNDDGGQPEPTSVVITILVSALSITTMSTLTATGGN